MHRSDPCAASAALIAALAALSSTTPAQAPAPGYRMYGPHGDTTTYLVDTNNTVVHTWPGSSFPGNGMYLERDGTLIRTGQVPGGPPIGGLGGSVQRIAFDGTVLWDYQLADATRWAHHDIEVLPNGNVLMIAWDLMTAADAIAAGRNPATLQSTQWLPDAIYEVQQTGFNTGAIVWEWHIMDHVIQDFDSSVANFGVVADHPEKIDINFPGNVLTVGEWNHCNSIGYDPVNDLIVLNSPFLNEFWFIDHSTTTAEAAGSTGGRYGRGGDILYRWGNPQSYRAGGPADQKLFFQHGTHFIPRGRRGGGNLLIFNNQAGTPVGESYSTVVELHPPVSFNLAPRTAWGPSGFVWEYKDPTPTNFFSAFVSNAERLPNGNTLVCSGRQGWLFEVTRDKQMVWSYQPALASPGIIFQVSYYDRSLWADNEILRAQSGGTVQFGLVAGSARANDSYLVLGTMSGTSPGFLYRHLPVPINLDAYTTALAHATASTLPTLAGVLDGVGAARATLRVPVLPQVTGLTLHHAFVAFDGTTLAPRMASNPVPLDIIR